MTMIQRNRNINPFVTHCIITTLNISGVYILWFIRRSYDKVCIHYNDHLEIFILQIYWKKYV